MPKSRLPILLLSVFVISSLGLCPTLCLAQSTSAAITGQITDSQGRAVPGVQVQAVDIDTNVVLNSTTNDSGIYSIPNIKPGRYRMLVLKDGFKAINKTGIELHVQDTLDQNFALEIGSINERVTVESGSSMINTTDASVSTVIDSSYVQNMPLNGRSFQDLILLTPGVVTNSPQVSGTLGMTGEFSVNGQRTEANYYTVDGVSANTGAAAGSPFEGAGLSGGSVAVSTALGTTQALVSVDALQEFRVQSSTYSAEYGRTPGGQFAFETKSGTNQWHGTAYDYLRNDYFDANEYFNDYLRPIEPTLTKPPMKQNDFGGTLGGVVWIPGLYNGKNKTFFFASYEGLRLLQPQAAGTFWVPDLCMRGAGACPTSGPGAGRMSAASGLLSVMNAFPVPSPDGLKDAANGFAQFVGTWSNPSALDSSSVRLDHAVNDKLRLFFRFSNTGSDSATRGTPPTEFSRRAYSSRTYTAGVDNIFMSRLSNEFRLNYSSNFVTSGTVINSFGGSTSAVLAQLTGLPNGSSIGVILLGGNFIVLSEDRSSGAQRQWNTVDVLSSSMGHHQLKFGMDYRRLAPFLIQPNFTAGYLYFSEASVETNDALAFAQALGPAHPLYTNLSVFIQDEWKLSRRLNLSLGLRWEVNPPPGVTEGLKPYTIQGTSPDNWTLAPQGTPLWATTWHNFAPRLGVAYVLHNMSGRETVVRVGGGVFFDTGQQLGSEGFGGPGFSQFGPYESKSFPVLPTLPALVQPPSPPYSQPVIGFAADLQLPYTVQWSLAVEQAIGKSQAFTVSYVGAHAAKLLQNNQIQSSINQNVPSGFFLVSNGLTSDYDSFQAQFRRRLNNGFTALGSYTWSHCLDYGSFNFNIGYQRGNCDFDVRSNFSGALSYDLPNMRNNSLVNTILNHWGFDDRVTVRSGFPIQLNGAQTFDPVTGKETSTGLDAIAGQPVYIYGNNCNSVYSQLAQSAGSSTPSLGCPGGKAINPCAFALPAPNQQPYSSCPGGNVGGLVPRNFARGFGAWQMDLALRREFSIYENLRLQFRAEAFNVFNHPNFGGIDTGFGSLTFGQANATLARSLGVLSPLYQTGGPRSMQFALKVVF